jgi:hypothetical protein
MAQFRSLSGLRSSGVGQTDAAYSVPQRFVAQPKKFHELGSGAAVELASMRPENETLEILKTEQKTLKPHTVCPVAKKT